MPERHLVVKQLRPVDDDVGPLELSGAFGANYVICLGLALPLPARRQSVDLGRRRMRRSTPFVDL
ncbi:hypothetical protein [Sinomonas sp. ASV322]|uniref:hypothetical protein n=1 Tax=Sinomonas sp. ASV322 TaxID=3041920 RepID=UPI0027DE73A1|nr:hypothetical protein [Sinomonas sp. ASV322]MDQ4502921.1 hypothetical protein [Sinomonas sp. ASV322]